MKKIISILIASLITLTITAQDFHLSQYESAEMYLNPALAGQNLSKGKDYRASSVYRSQWGSVSSKAYSTSYLAYDQKFKERWGLGVNLINNQAGASGFRTFNFMLAGSYNIMSNSNNKHILTTGLQLGLMNKSIQTDDLTFDEQYSSSTGGFNETASNGENFQTNSLYKFDVNWGIFYKFNPRGKNYHPYTGLSVSHISLPGQNFTQKNEVMPLQWKFNLGTKWEINDNFGVTPGILYMYQKSATEIIIKSNVVYHLNNKDYDIRSNLGYRIKDALIVGFGMRYKDIIGSISYDYNTSYLNNYTGGNGGFEISISYQGAFKPNRTVPSLY